MPAADRDSHNSDIGHPDSEPEACPTCGAPLDAHARGAVDFYCPAPREACDGD